MFVRLCDLRICVCPWADNLACFQTSSVIGFAIFTSVTDARKTNKRLLKPRDAKRKKRATTKYISRRCTSSGLEAPREKGRTARSRSSRPLSLFFFPRIKLFTRKLQERRLLLCLKSSVPRCGSAGRIAATPAPEIIHATPRGGKSNWTQTDRLDKR